MIGEDGEELGRGPGRPALLPRPERLRRDVPQRRGEDRERAPARPGLFTIGEVGYVDDEGYLYLTDRFSDQVISGGVNIFPAEAELVMIELPGVADVACIGVPDDDLGEVLHALVVPADADAEPSAERLIAQTRGRLTKFKCPRVGSSSRRSLGRNPLGKLNKIDLREAFLAGELA